VHRADLDALKVKGGAERRIFGLQNVIDVVVLVSGHEDVDIARRDNWRKLQPAGRTRLGEPDVDILLPPLVASTGGQDAALSACQVLGDGFPPSRSPAAVRQPCPGPNTVIIDPRHGEGPRREPGQLPPWPPTPPTVTRGRASPHGFPPGRPPARPGRTVMPAVALCSVVANAAGQRWRYPPPAAPNRPCPAHTRPLLSRGRRPRRARAG
jgi:hypothetical protein